MDTVSIITHKNGKKELVYEPRIQKGDSIGEINQNQIDDIIITPTKLTIEEVKNWSLEQVEKFLYSK